MSNSPDAFDKQALEIRDLVLKRSAELREHCDSVIIVCTINEGTDSQLIYDYKGNIYAVRGSADRFVEMLAAKRRKMDEIEEGDQ